MNDSKSSKLLVRASTSSK